MENSAPQKNNRTVIILLAVIVVLLAAVLGMFVLKDKGSDTPQLGYASEGVTVVDDTAALQAAANELLEKAKDGRMGLSYKREAISNDGKNFVCYIGNSKVNSNDMYLGIYADDTFQDQLFLSGLIRPGEAFESFTLDRTLEKGKHEVYLVHTTVKEDLATIKGQVVVKLDLIVR